MCFHQMRVHCHTQRMGGIADIKISQCENYVISVGQERQITIWNMHTNDAVFKRFIDGENDEAMAVAMYEFYIFAIS